MNTDISTLARVLAGIESDGNDGNSATAAWAELLGSLRHSDPMLLGDFEREYDSLGKQGPDTSGGQARRIERLLHLTPESTLANVAGWLDMRKCRRFLSAWLEAPAQIGGAPPPESVLCPTRAGTSAA